MKCWIEGSELPWEYVVSSDFVHVQRRGKWTRNGECGVLLRGFFNWVDKKD